MVSPRLYTTDQRSTNTLSIIVLPTYTVSVETMADGELQADNVIHIIIIDGFMILCY